MTITLAILLLVQAGPVADPDPLLATAAGRLSATDPAPVEPKRSPYRIDGAAAGATAKDRAIGEDGTRCSIVGSRVCTRKPRTVLSAPLGQ